MVAVKSGELAVNEYKNKIDEGKFFTLIFMDIYMPGGNGDVATEEIRKIEEEQEVPIKMKVIGMSGEFNEKIKARCIGKGMDDFMAKPLKMQEAASIVWD